MISFLLSSLLVILTVAGTIVGGSLFMFSEHAHRQLLGAALFVMSLTVLVSFVTGYLLS